jgi:DNA ligase (NAD+)
VFFEFIKDLPVTISYEDKNIESENLKGKSFVFTGVRRKDLNEIIESNGGKVSTSVSKNTTYLVVKELGSGSSKEVKATSLGIEILSVEGLEKILNEI